MVSSPVINVARMVKDWDGGQRDRVVEQLMRSHLSVVLRFMLISQASAGELYIACRQWSERQSQYVRFDT